MVSRLRPSMRALAKALLCGCFYYSGLTGLIARWFPRRRPIILCAHRIVSGEDPFFPGILQERFAADVAYLTRHHRVLPLSEVKRAHELWKKLKEQYVPPPLDPAVAEAVDASVARRRAEIGA